MKKFIHKLNSRLDEHIETAKAEGDYTYIKPFEIAKNTVNQLAEEYKLFGNSEQVKPRTNADKIRAMTDEELAEVIFNCPITESCIHWNDEVHCQQCIREWLQSEAKE